MLKRRRPGCNCGISALADVEHRIEEGFDFEIVKKGFMAVKGYGLLPFTDLAPEPLGIQKRVGANP
jgi:hypothetical protein